MIWKRVKEQEEQIQQSNECINTSTRSVYILFLSTLFYTFREYLVWGSCLRICVFFLRVVSFRLTERSVFIWINSFMHWAVCRYWVHRMCRMYHGESVYRESIYKAHGTSNLVQYRDQSLYSPSSSSSSSIKSSFVPGALTS